MSGFQFRLPTFIAIQVLLVSVPLAFGLTELNRLFGRMPAGVANLSSASFALVLLCIWRTSRIVPPILIALLAMFVVRFLTWPPPVMLNLVTATICTVLWLTAVQFVNYIILRARITELRIRCSKQSMSRSIQYFLPLVHTTTSFRLFVVPGSLPCSRVPI